MHILLVTVGVRGAAPQTSVARRAGATRCSAATFRCTLARVVINESTMLRSAACAVTGAVIGAGVLYILRRQRRLVAIADAECYELKGEYYQVLGHAWDHQTKDFKVIYRPLYHCPSAVDRFEAHVLAASHFERWDDKFKRVPLSSLPAAAARLVLPGPFVHDPEWTGAPR